MRNKAYLFGPFFGELSWEYFRFAPYAIYLKKISPNIKMIVLTRPSRFDLYGQYADTLIPQRIAQEDEYNQSAFKLKNYGDVIYENLAKRYRSIYEKKYNIVDHYYPDISGWRYKVKWQFPKDRMDYNFIARTKHKEIVDNFVDKDSKIILTTRKYDYPSDEYSVVNIDDFIDDIEYKVDDESITFLGCTIELIKASTLVASTLHQDVGHLAILLRKPLIYLNRRMKKDTVQLMNPLNTLIIDCKAVSEGVEIYENNI